VVPKDWDQLGSEIHGPGALGLGRLEYGLAVRQLDQRIKASARQIAALVKASGSTLTEVFGVGPVIAGRVIAEVGDVGRFPDADHFASFRGTAPIEASSGDQVRHRLSRRGNRRLNHATHMAAVTQIRHPHSRAGLLRAQASRGQGAQGGPALPQATTLRHRLSPARERSARQNRSMRVTYDGRANAAYISFTEDPLSPGRESVPLDPPEGKQAFIVADWKDGKIVRLQILGATDHLHRAFLDQAEIIG
jgi:uncharacterized protein YuzE